MLASSYLSIMIQKRSILRWRWLPMGVMIRPGRKWNWAGIRAFYSFRILPRPKLSECFYWMRVKARVARKCTWNDVHACAYATVRSMCSLGLHYITSCLITLVFSGFRQRNNAKSGRIFSTSTGQVQIGNSPYSISATTRALPCVVYRIHYHDRNGVWSTINMHLCQWLKNCAYDAFEFI